MNELWKPDINIGEELAALQARNLKRDRTLVLFSGPSGVGKSTIMNALNPNEYQQIQPIITRPLREGEVDKKRVAEKDFDAMLANGELINSNEVFGAKYGLKLESVLKPLKEGKVPVTDMSLPNVDSIRRPNDYDVLSIYIYPGHPDNLNSRLAKAGRLTEDRLLDGLVELDLLANSSFLHPNIDLSIVNQEGQLFQTVEFMEDMLNLVLAH